MGTGWCPSSQFYSRDRLNQVFGNNRVVGLGHNVEWPPCLPDLTPCDFFTWEYLKDNFFSTPPWSIDELKQTIVDNFNSLKDQLAVIRRVRHMHKQTLLCLGRNWATLKGIVLDIFDSCK